MFSHVIKKVWARAHNNSIFMHSTGVRNLFVCVHSTRCFFQRSILLLFDIFDVFRANFWKLLKILQLYAKTTIDKGFFSKYLYCICYLFKHQLCTTMEDPMYIPCVFIRYYFNINLFLFSIIATEKISLYLMLLKPLPSGDFDSTFKNC